MPVIYQSICGIWIDCFQQLNWTCIDSKLSTEIGLCQAKCLSSFLRLLSANLDILKLSKIEWLCNYPDGLRYDILSSIVKGACVLSHVKQPGIRMLALHAWASTVRRVGSKKYAGMTRKRNWSASYLQVYAKCWEPNARLVEFCRCVWMWNSFIAVRVWEICSCLRWGPLCTQ